MNKMDRPEDEPGLDGPFTPAHTSEEAFGAHLDCIFEEVEKNLPSIDFDMSDVSSDEEVAIFQRTIKTPTFDEDKDLDESLTSESWEQLLREADSGPVNIPDNDIMARIQQEKNGGVGHEKGGSTPKNNSEFSVQQPVMIENEDSISTLSLRSIREEVESELMSQISGQDDNVLMSMMQSVTKTQQSMGTNIADSPPGGSSNEETVTGIKINTWVNSHPETSTSTDRPKSVDDNTQNQTDNAEQDNRTVASRKTRVVQEKPEDMVSRYLPTSALSLTFQDLDNIDFDAALTMQEEGSRPVSLPLRRTTNPSRPSPGSTTTQAEDNENISLIEKLARLTVSQSGKKMQEYDPTTGALTQPGAAGDNSDARGATHRSAIPSKWNNAKALKTAKNRSVEAQQKSTSTTMEAASAWGIGQEAFDQMFSALDNSTQSGFHFSSPPPGTATSKPPKEETKRDTIYIDLRNFDIEKHQQQMSFEAVQRILRLPPQDQPEESSDEEEEVASGGDLSLWHEQRRKMKQALREGKTITHPDQFETEKATDPAKPGKPDTTQKTVQSPKKISPQSNTAKTTAVNEPDTKPSSEMSNTTTSSAKSNTKSSAATKPPIPASPMVDKEKQKRAEATRKAREARAAEHQSRVRLGRQLEALRPSTTVTERHPAAEATPCVFDLEASYEPSLEILPTDLLAEREVLLLTIKMECNGEIVLHRGSANRSVDSGHGLSASYTTLVTWILSLVPDDFSFLKSPPGGAKSPSTGPYMSVPFQVLALQQMVLDEQLALYVAVCPAEGALDSSPRGKKSKKRGDDFSSIVTKFLSTNTLHTVCPWLNNLISMEVTSPISDDSRPFVYRPPLPNITKKPLSTFVQINTGAEAVRRVFSLPVGFFWHTVESDDTLAEVGDTRTERDIQNTMSLIYKKIYRDPSAMMGILNRLLQEGLDLSGLRLLYPTTTLMSVATSPPTSGTPSSEGPNQLDLLNKVGPIVALSIRGMFARTLWLDAVGPADPVLARRTDPNSLCALYGGNSREECLIFCPRNPERISTELARWFGGRVPASGVVNVGTSHRKRSDSGSRRSKGSRPSSAETSPNTSTLDESEFEIPKNNPAVMLTATIRGHILLVISPLVPTRCLGLVLATCQRRGYMLQGVRRQHLTTKRASGLGLTSTQIPAFTKGLSSSPQPTNVAFSEQSTSDPATWDTPSTHVRPCTTILLNKENASHSSASLIEAFMVQLCLMDLLGAVQSSISDPLTSSLLFHTLPHSESAMNILGRNFSKVPEVDRVITPGYIAPKLHTNPEMEQIVTVTLTGHKNMSNFGLLLGRLLGVVPLSNSNRNPPTSSQFELLAIKWLPALSMQHAKELTPYEIGDPQWRASLHTLTSEPAVVVALRGVDGYSRLASILLPNPGPSLHRLTKPSLECLVAPSPDATYRQMALFFTDKEVFADNSVRKLLNFLPPLRSRISVQPESSEQVEVSQQESLYETLLSGPRPIVTLLMAKPDIVRRHLGKLLKRLSHDGFALVGARLLVLDAEQANVVIPTEDKDNEVLCEMHRAYLTSAPSMVLALQRENAIYRLNKILGPSDPAMARKAGQHYLRGLFGSDAIANGLHASSSYSAAVKEIKIFFPDGLCCQTNLDLEEDGINCPAEDVIIDIRPTRTVIKAETETASIPLATTKNSGTTPVNWSLPVSTLTETNCLLLMPSLLKQAGRGRKAPYVEIIDGLTSHGFDVVGTRMVWLTEDQAQHYLCLINAGSFQLVPLLRSGPCLILALQRDNAVIAFDALNGLYSRDSIYAKYGSQILRPKDNKQAKKHLAFFFDELSPVATLQISNDTSTTNGES